MFDKGNKFDTGRKELDVSNVGLIQITTIILSLTCLYKSIYQFVDKLAI